MTGSLYRGFRESIKSGTPETCTVKDRFERLVIYETVVESVSDVVNTVPRIQQRTDGRVNLNSSRHSYPYLLCRQKGPGSGLGWGITYELFMNGSRRIFIQLTKKD